MLKKDKIRLSIIIDQTKKVFSLKGAAGGWGANRHRLAECAPECFHPGEY